MYVIRDKEKKINVIHRKTKQDAVFENEEKARLILKIYCSLYRVDIDQFEIVPQVTH